VQIINLNSVGCEKLTKIAKAIGSENIGPQRTVFGILALAEVNSFLHKILENKGKIRLRL